MIAVLVSILVEGLPGRFLPALSPTGAVLLGTVGLCLVALEFNRPGSVVPGALGLLLVLFAVSTFYGRAVRPAAVLLLLAATTSLLLNVWFRLPWWLLLTATLVIPYGLHRLVPASEGGVGWAAAAICGVTLGTLGAGLSRVALRARRAKRVN